MPTHVMSPGGHLMQEHQDSQFQALLILEGVLRLGVEMSYFNALLKFPKRFAWVLRDQFPVAHLPDYMARLLATTH